MSYVSFHSPKDRSVIRSSFKHTVSPDLRPWHAMTDSKKQDKTPNKLDAQVSEAILRFLEDYPGSPAIQIATGSLDIEELLLTVDRSFLLKRTVSPLLDIIRFIRHDDPSLAELQSANSLCESDLVKKIGAIHTDEGYVETKFDRASLRRVVLEQLFPIVYVAVLTLGPDNVAMSFNGGKDCTVLLHIVIAAIELYYLRKGTYEKIESFKLKTLYVACSDGYIELDKFVDMCSSRYALELSETRNGLKEGLSNFMNRYKEVKAVFIGTRYSDPHSSALKYFQRTDGDWFPVLRIHPVLHFEYDQVWAYIKVMGMDYCSLYDEGYTSLGHPLTTVRNPELLDAKTNTYRPAYLLAGGNASERLGRNVNH